MTPPSPLPCLPRTLSRAAASPLLLIALAACGTQTDNNTTARATTAAVRDTVLIDGTSPSCTTCSLRVVDSLQLGTPSDSEIPQRVPSNILRDSRGIHYLVFNDWVNKPILRYDATGRFLGRLGGYGNGPGEYTVTGAAFLGSADSVFVLPSGRRMAQLFDANATYIRTTGRTEKPIVGAVPDGSGDVYIYNNMEGFDLRSINPSGSTVPTDHALHVIRVAPDGAVKDSLPLFSPRTGMTPRGTGADGIPVIVQTRLTPSPIVAPDGSIWAILGGSYRLEKHAPDGRSQQVIGVALPGVRPPVLTLADAESLAVERARVISAGRRGMRVPREASFTPPIAVQVDDAGLIWVVRRERAPRADTIVVAYEYLASNEAPGERTVPRNTDDRLWHTVVDVIDSDRGELLARTTLPFLGMAVSPGYVGRVRIADDGHFLIHVYELTLGVPFRK